MVYLRLQFCVQKKFRYALVLISHVGSNTPISEIAESWLFPDVGMNIIIWLFSVDYDVVNIDFPPNRENSQLAQLCQLSN